MVIEIVACSVNHNFLGPFRVVIGFGLKVLLIYRRAETL
jgi:hypothetical protein